MNWVPAGAFVAPVKLTFIVVAQLFAELTQLLMFVAVGVLGVVIFVPAAAKLGTTPKNVTAGRSNKRATARDTCLL